MSRSGTSIVTSHFMTCALLKISSTSILQNPISLMLSKHCLMVSADFSFFISRLEYLACKFNDCFRAFKVYFYHNLLKIRWLYQRCCLRSEFVLLNGASLSSSNRSLWSFVLYSAQNCGGKARLIGLKNVVCMVPRFPAKSLGQESTSWTCIVNCIRVDRAFPLVWETISENQTRYWGVWTR